MRAAAVCTPSSRTPAKEPQNCLIFVNELFRIISFSYQTASAVYIKHIRSLDYNIKAINFRYVFGGLIFVIVAPSLLLVRSAQMLRPDVFCCVFFHKQPNWRRLQKECWVRHARSRSINSLSSRNKLYSLIKHRINNWRNKSFSLKVRSPCRDGAAVSKQRMPEIKELWRERLSRIESES